MEKTYYIVCDYREKFNEGQNTDHYSYNSILQLKNTINSLGYKCIYFGGVNELLKELQCQTYDNKGIYLNFNDGINTVSKRGQTPILLEMMGVKYSGSSPLTHLAISNKYFANNYLTDKIKGLHVPLSKIIKNKEDICRLRLQYPIIIKPNDEGSSLGISNSSVCENFQHAARQFKKIEKYGKILAQEFANGYELTNYFIRSDSKKILFNELLLLSKDNAIKMDYKVFTADDKLNHKREYYDPLRVLSGEEISKIKNMTEEIADLLDILTIGRIDYRYDNGRLSFIEANTVPAFSQTSDIGELCKIYHISFENIVSFVIKSLD